MKLKSVKDWLLRIGSVLRTSIRMFYIRINVSFNILFNPSAHWFFVSIDRDNLIKLLKDEEFVVTHDYHRMQWYIMRKIMKMTAPDDAELIIDKANFEINCEHDRGA